MRHHPVPGTEPGHFATDGLHASGGIRSGNKRKAKSRKKFSFDHAFVPIVERDRRNPNEQFARTGLRNHPFSELKRVEAEALEFPLFHHRLKITRCLTAPMTIAALDDALRVWF